MTAYAAFSTATSNTSAPVYSLANGDTLLVAEPAMVANLSTGVAIAATGTVNIDVLGDIYTADNVAIHLDQGASFSSVWIGEDASVVGNPGVFGDGAIFMEDSNASVINHGSITSDGLGIRGTSPTQTVTNFGTIDGIRGVDLSGNDAQLVNYGTIRGGRVGGGSGGNAVGIGGGSSQLVNFGTIENIRGNAVLSTSVDGETVTLINHGVLRGSPNSSVIVGGSGDETLINSGDIFGRVTLGLGDDVVDNRDGFVEATIFGGGGNDSFMIDSSNATGLDRVDGETGSDTIDLSGAAAAVWIDLGWNGVQVFTSGGAVATNVNATTMLARVSNVENIIGSGGSDIVRGNGADNSYGYTGHHAATVDQFFGGDGSDTFDASYLGEMGSAVWVDLTLAGADAWTSSQETATNANATIRIAALDSVENVVGTLFSDRVFGTGDANTYFYNGNDRSGSGLGPADFFDARGGDDTIDFSLSPFSVWVSLATPGVEAWSSTSIVSSDANANTRIVDLASVENVVGSIYADTIRGSSGDNRVDGFGTVGAFGFEDVIMGLGGNDTFVFENGYRLASIGDFVAGGTQDSIELSGFGSAYNTFSEVVAAATQVGADVEIDFGDGDVLTLSNVTLGNLTADDFTFA